MEHDEHAEELEREAKKLDEHSEEVGEQIAEARREWEAREDDPSVPGAQPPDDQEEEESVPGEEGTATGNPDAAGADDEEDHSGA